MGHVFAEIELSNPREPGLLPVKVTALADTGALMLCIPEHLALQLKLETESEREVSVAGGRSKNVPYVGPIRVQFGKRFCFVGALVLGDEVLLAELRVEHERIVTAAASEFVVPAPPAKSIISITGVDDVIPRIRVDLVVARAGRDGDRCSAGKGQV